MDKRRRLRCKYSILVFLNGWCVSSQAFLSVLPTLRIPCKFNVGYTALWQFLTMPSGRMVKESCLWRLSTISNKQLRNPRLRSTRDGCISRATSIKPGTSDGSFSREPICSTSRVPRTSAWKASSIYEDIGSSWTIRSTAANTVSKHSTSMNAHSSFTQTQRIRCENGLMCWWRQPLPEI